MSDLAPSYAELKMAQDDATELRREVHSLRDALKEITQLDVPSMSYAALVELYNACSDEITRRNIRVDQD